MAKYIPVLSICSFNQSADIVSPSTKARLVTVHSENGTGYIAKHVGISSRALTLSKNELKIVAAIVLNFIY
jgi:hypothetical protein